MERDEIVKETSAAFSGHRFIPVWERAALKAAVAATVANHYAEGIHNFICGMAVGFDLLAAEAVLDLKNRYRDMTLTAAVPFRNQPDRFSEADKGLYWHIMGKADRMVVLSEAYFEGCFLRRNDYMLHHASRLIVYFNGERKGGTFYTCRKALRLGLTVVNLYK